MNTTDANALFNRDNFESNRYVDWTMQVEPRAAYEKVVELFSRWEELSDGRTNEEVVGALRVISSSCGLIRRIFSATNQVDLSEKLDLVDRMYEFFRANVAGKTAPDVSFMWWDHLAVAYSLPEIDEPSRGGLDARAIRARLMSTFEKSVLSGDANQQLSALHAIDCLNDPGGKAIVQELLAKSMPLRADVKQLATSIVEGST